MKLACYARVVVAVGLSMTAAYGASEPQEVFRDPPREAHAGVWWHWKRMGTDPAKRAFFRDFRDVNHQNDLGIG